VAGVTRRRLGRLALHLLGGAVATFQLAPFALSLLVSLHPRRSIGLPTPATGYTLDWYAFVLADPLYRRGLGTSLAVGGLTAVLAVGLALPLVVAQSRRPRLRPLAALVVLPALTPGVVLGLQSLVAFELVGLRGTRSALALAHTLWGLPLAYLVLRAAYARLDPALRDAARSLGAGPVRAGWEVTLPLLAPSLAVAALLAFVASLNELLMSLFLASGTVRTLPTVLWPQVRHAVRPDVAAASGLLLAAALALALPALWLWRRADRWDGPRRTRA
jgi:putative spermidine/putrescine transport system permease protein